MSNLAIRYSLADVAKCNGKNGTRTWIVIYDNIYDVTDYIQQVRAYKIVYYKLHIFKCIYVQ